MKKIILSILTLGVGVWAVSAADAAANWNKQCAKCHGKDGKAQTTMGKRLKLKDYTKAEVQAKLKDEAMVKAIKEGVKKGGKTRMKGFASKLKDDEIKQLVAYIRKMKK